jgi:hypothetical protein
LSLAREDAVYIWTRNVLAKSEDFSIRGIYNRH